MKNNKKANNEATCDVCDLSDAYKFMSFSLRSLVHSVIGRSMGDLKFDDAVGKAATEIKDLVEVAAVSFEGAIIVNVLVGVW